MTDQRPKGPPTVAGLGGGMTPEQRRVFAEIGDMIRYGAPPPPPISDALPPWLMDLTEEDVAFVKALRGGHAPVGFDPNSYDPNDPAAELPAGLHRWVDPDDASVKIMRRIPCPDGSPDWGCLAVHYEEVHRYLRPGPPGQARAEPLAWLPVGEPGQVLAIGSDGEPCWADPAGGAA